MAMTTPGGSELIVSPAMARPVLVDRLRAELKLKLVGTAAITLWLSVPYLLLERFQLFTVTPMSAGFVDRAIPFSDKAVWPYLSVYALLLIGPALMIRREPLLRYAFGLAAMGVVADAVFLFWPTMCPRPDPAQTITLYQKLVSIDTPGNSFPSLHAGYAVYGALFAVQVLSEMRAGPIWKLLVWIWALLVLYATIATRQHVFTDIVAGSLLGWLAFLIPRRGA
jgi:membrane-associated phospholipid phosphatase